MSRHLNIAIEIRSEDRTTGFEIETWQLVSFGILIVDHGDRETSCELTNPPVRIKLPSWFRRYSDGSFLTTGVTRAKGAA